MLPPQFIPQSELDVAAYEACLVAAGAALPYAHYAWLRAVANGKFVVLAWPDGNGGYRAVMPLPERRKVVVLPYVALPPFTQRLGLFTRPGQDQLAMAAEAARLLRRSYLRVDLSVDEEAVAHTLSDRVEVRRNRVLNLSQSVEALERSLGKSIRQKLKDADKAGLTLEKGPTALTPFRFIRDALAPRLKSWTTDYDYAWGRLCLVPDASFILEGWLAKLGDVTVGAAVFVRYGERIIYLAGASNAQGLETGAMAALLWKQILLNANRPGAVLDFEGGNLGGTKQFFSMFGADEEPFYGLRIGL